MAANKLYKAEDESIMKYEKRPLLRILADRHYHSPEISETDKENASSSVIAVYDYSWRSAEVWHFSFFFCFFAFLLISKFQSILLIRIPFLVENPPSKCTRLALDGGQITTTMTIRRRNSTFRSVAFSERP